MFIIQLKNLSRILSVSFLLTVNIFAGVTPNLNLDSPFGVNTHARPETYEVPHIKRMGANWVRVHFSQWHIVEKKRGEYTFTPEYDNYVKAYHSAGINQLNILCYGNTLYCDKNANPQHPLNVAPRSEKALEAWGNYVEATVAHYSKLGVKYWEIWNEPTFDTFFGKGEKAKHYEKILKIAYTRAKKADPDAFIVGCSTGHIDLNFIETVLKAGGGKYMDAVSVHPYNSNPESYHMTKKLNDLTKLMTRYGFGDKPIWITELGVATSHQPESIVAGLIIRNIAMMLASPRVERFFWYDFRDDGTNPDYIEHNMGLVKNKISRDSCIPKAGFFAYRFASIILKDKYFSKTIPVGNNNYAYLFQNNENENVLILWNTMSGVVPLKGVPPSALLRNIYGEFIPFERNNNLAMIGVSRTPVYLSFTGTNSDLSTPDNKGFITVSPSDISIMGPGKNFTRTASLTCINPLPEDLKFKLATSVPYGYICNIGPKQITVKSGQTELIPIHIFTEHNDAARNGTIEFSLISDTVGAIQNIGTVNVSYFKQKSAYDNHLDMQGRLISSNKLQIELSTPATVSAALFDNKGKRISGLFQGRELSKGKHIIPVKTDGNHELIHITATKSSPVLLDNIKYIFSGFTRTINSASTVSLDKKGLLYVLSPGADQAILYKVNDVGNAVWSLPIPPDQYFQAMICGDNDDIFIASWRKGMVIRVVGISTEKPHIAWMKKLIDEPLEFATDGKGHTYIASVQNNAVLCIDKDGNVVTSFADKGYLRFSSPQPKALSNLPASIVILNDILYVGGMQTRTITAYNVATGKPEGLSFGNEKGGKALYGNNGIGPFATDGKYIFAVEDEMNRVSVYDKKGNFLTRWDSKSINGIKYSYPWDAASGPDGSIYVSNRVTGNIIRVLPRISVAELDVPLPEDEQNNKEEK